MRPAAVLFDLDGTLIDSIELIMRSARHAFAKHACDWPSDDRWRGGIGTPLRAQFQAYTSERVGVEDFLAAYREYQLAHHDALVRCYDDIPSVVAELRARGHPLAIVTSKSDPLARRGLEHVGLLEAFSTVVGCDSLDRHKPDPAPVRLALERIGYDASEAFFVGDSVHDIEAGNRAGVATIGVLWGPNAREDLAPARPTYLAERARDLLVLTSPGSRSPSPAGRPRP